MSGEFGSAASSGGKFGGRLGVQQRVLPVYRVPFFDLLAQSCEGGMSLFAGTARPEEGIIAADPSRLPYCVPARNRHFLRGALYLCYQEGIAAWLESANPDVLVMEANPRYLSAPRAVQWMRARRRPVIGWGLGAPLSLGGRVGAKLWARFLGQFAALIAYSRRGAAEYAALGFPKERIFVATNAAAPRPTSSPPQRPPSFAGRPVVLYVGRLQARKRADWLLRACAEMPEPKPRLILVGDGPQRAQLEALARRVYPAAEFPGAKHGAALSPYFAEADLFVLPGTGGLAVQEAMAHGLPVIVAKGDGTQDDLVREENGWQIPPDDYRALVDTLRRALSDAGRLRVMGAASFRIVLDEINLERMVETFVEALNSL